MAIRESANVPGIASEGDKLNPGSLEVLADTGALAAGNYEMRVFAGTTLSSSVLVQRRNAANAANVGVAPRLYTAANLTAEYVFTFRLEASERVRVLMGEALTGTAHGAIQYEVLC